MSIGKKILFLLLAIVPLIFFGLYMYEIIDLITLQQEQLLGNMFPTENIFIERFGIMFLYVGIGGILSLVAMVFYILDVVSNKKFVNENSSLKVVWLLIVILLSNLGMIIYFFVEIVNRKEGIDYHAKPITDRTN